MNQNRSLIDAYTLKVFLIMLALAPAGVLIIKGWINWTLFLASFLSIIYLIRNRFSLAPFQSNWLITGFMIALLSPMLAIAISQAIRHSWSWAPYDSPSRFLISIPIFILIYKLRIQITNIWQYSFPIATIVTLIALPWLPNSGWPVIEPDRLSTYFVDPLTFGRISLAFALLSLASINLHNDDSRLAIIIKLLGFFSGLYLSIGSGSRTGWLALPIALLIIIYAHTPKQYRIRSIVALTIIFIIGLSLIYLQSRTVNVRINQAIDEVSEYKLDQVNPDHSVGMRLSFARMGLYYFQLQPLSGWGDKGFIKHINDPEIAKFASSFTREFALNNGFHNEITTNAVRSGIWGIVSTLLLFCMPLAIFIKALSVSKLGRVAVFGIIYVTCEFISGMSTEVLNLKFTAALYSLVISALSGSILQEYINEKNYEPK